MKDINIYDKITPRRMLTLKWIIRVEYAQYLVLLMEWLIYESQRDASGRSAKMLQVNVFRWKRQLLRPEQFLFSTIKWFYM